MVEGLDFHFLADIFRNSVLITGLVTVMMIMIEYVNIQSGGRMLSRLKGNSFLQVVVASLLGMVPGCIGGFAAVSLYTHRLVSFGALVAMMICSSGDEAFVMLAMIPETALVLFVLLFLFSVAVGYAVDRVCRKRHVAEPVCEMDFNVHKADVIPSLFRMSSYSALRHPGRKRLLILLFIGLFSTAVLSGILEHDHSSHMHDAECGTVHAGSCTEETCSGIRHDMHACDVHGHDHAHGPEGGIDILNERWMNVVFGILGLFTLLLTLVANEHFVDEHLWNHIVKKHLLSIFLWTFGALFVVQYALEYLDLRSFISNNMWAVLILAVIVGLIPESGPHMVFISLFAGGIIPFSVLFANSVVQDGHTALPLLADNRKDFFRAKLINMAAGLAAGFVMMSFGL